MISTLCVFLPHGIFQPCDYGLDFFTSSYVRIQSINQSHADLEGGIASTFNAHFMPLVGVGKRGAYLLVYGDLSRQHSFGTTLRFTGPVPADSRQ